MRIKPFVHANPWSDPLEEAEVGETTWPQEVLLDIPCSRSPSTVVSVPSLR